MSRTYQLPPEMSERLEDEAARRNMAPDEIVLSLVDSFLASSQSREDGSPQGEAERFRLWAASHSRDIPPIPPEAMSREYFYEERG